MNRRKKTHKMWEEEIFTKETNRKIVKLISSGYKIREIAEALRRQWPPPLRGRRTLQITSRSIIASRFSGVRLRTVSA